MYLHIRRFFDMNHKRFKGSLDNSDAVNPNKNAGRSALSTY